MRIRIDDIPPEGRQLQFNLDRAKLNDRVALDRLNAEKNHGVEQPAYVFESDPTVELSLQLEGSTVVVSGRALATFSTICSRCAEPTSPSMVVPLDIVLKPTAARTAESEEAEDLHFGFYENEEIFCDMISEEFVVLALPFTVLCSEECKGLCPRCGKNLNEGPCSCPPEQRGDPRFQVLRDLKIQ